MTTQDILELAARCEAKAFKALDEAFAYNSASYGEAYPQAMAEHADTWLRCAAALKARAHTKGEE